MLSGPLMTKLIASRLSNSPVQRLAGMSWLAVVLVGAASGGAVAFAAVLFVRARASTPLLSTNPSQDPAPSDEVANSSAPRNTNAPKVCFMHRRFNDRVFQTIQRSCVSRKQSCGAGWSIARLRMRLDLVTP